LIERLGHWGAILFDRTSPEIEDTPEYILRSELLACIALFRRQMNKTIWRTRKTRPPKFVRWELDVKDGPIKVSTLNGYPCLAIYLTLP
jgi:hypothetical protein